MLRRNLTDNEYIARWVVISGVDLRCMLRILNVLIEDTYVENK